MKQALLRTFASAAHRTLLWGALSLAAVSFAACSSSNDDPEPQPTPEPEKPVDPTPTPTPENPAAQGWPKEYSGVMLQGFYWDSFSASQWTALEQMAPELRGYFSLLWVPQSGRCIETGNSMGYDPYYFFDQNSSFGSEAQLRSMISAMRTADIGVIADVVVNHHNTDGWFSFPKETYGGETYQLLSTDITANDDGGATATEAGKQGVKLSANRDESDDFVGNRDLDHQSENVQRVVKAYEQYLLRDLGYAGFRYDMVKGFAASHVGDYNRTAQPAYSVGEYWDGVAKIRTWIDGTQKQSAAFDFPFRYSIQKACNGGSFSTVTEPTLISSGYKQYAVTFVENHDTQRRDGQENDPLKQDTLAANAYLLAMPGTPCVFFRHYIDYPQQIKSMIDLRHQMGITNTSDHQQEGVKGGYAAYRVKGQNGTLVVVVGRSAADYQPAADQQLLFAGYHYRYYTVGADAAKPQVVVSHAAGTYEGAIEVTLASTDGKSKIAYTTDGSTPSATHGTQVESGSRVAISESGTLRAVAVADGAAPAVERTYTITAPFKQRDITIYVAIDKVDWPSLNIHSWGDYRTGTTWPGDAVTATKEVGGRTWYYKNYSITSARDYVNFVFDYGTADNASQHQTVDVTNVTTDTYFEVLPPDEDGGKYKVQRVQQ